MNTAIVNIWGKMAGAVAWMKNPDWLLLNTILLLKDWDGNYPP